MKTSSGIPSSAGLPKIDTAEKLYEVLKSEHPKELDVQMKLLHLTPSMMEDKDFTISKYLRYIVENDIKIPKQQMEQVLSLVKLEDKYRTDQMQNGATWVNRINITSIKNDTPIEWRSRAPEITMSLEEDISKVTFRDINMAYKTLEEGLKQYHSDSKSWLEDYKAHEQIKAIANSLNIKIDLEKFVESEKILLGMLKRSTTQRLPQDLTRKVLEAIIKHADDHIMAAKEVAKQGSDDVARAAADNVIASVDHAIQPPRIILRN